MWLGEDIGGATRAEFIRNLTQLSGDDFERAVQATLEETHPGFQRIPRIGGDGGLDGVSHHFTIGYCCYGPITLGATALDKGLRKKISDKFRDDLRRIFEVAPNGRANSLAHKRNPEIEEVLIDRRLKMIRLIVNVFKDKSLIGQIGKEFRKCAQASKRRFVDDTCEWTIWGPETLATKVAISEQALFRLRDPVVASVFQKCGATTVPPEATDERILDDKFDDLAGRLGAHARAVAELTRTRHKEAWARALSFEVRLSSDAPAIYSRLEKALQHIELDAARLSLVPSAPMVRVEEVRTRLRDAVEPILGQGISDTQLQDFLDGELARLIGQCALEWRES